MPLRFVLFVIVPFLPGSRLPTFCNRYLLRRQPVQPVDKLVYLPTDERWMYLHDKGLLVQGLSPGGIQQQKD